MLTVTMDLKVPGQFTVEDQKVIESLPPLIQIDAALQIETSWLHCSRPASLYTRTREGTNDNVNGLAKMLSGSV